MIDTHQTSMLPPPVPQRLNNSGPILVPVAAERNRQGNAVLKVVVVVVLFNLLLSLVGFYYMYHNGTLIPSPLMDTKPTDEGESSLLSSEKRSHTAMASMTVKQPSRTAKDKVTLGYHYLEWNMEHSKLWNIDYYRASWLTVRKPGDYYVYARVTFSRGEPSVPLVSRVTFRQDKTGKERPVMTAYCSLDSRHPSLCTATQGEVMSLKQGNQLSVWVQNLSFVDYEEGATSFGMYKL